MFKKTLIATIAAAALMVGLQAPANAAMTIAPPAATQSEAAQSEGATNIIEVRGGRRGFRGGHRRFRHRGWRHRGWRHRGWRYRSWRYRNYRYYGRWHRRHYRYYY